MRRRAVRRLRNDIVDDDLKGLAPWLHKHVRYAELEAQRRSNDPASGSASTRCAIGTTHGH